MSQIPSHMFAALPVPLQPHHLSAISKQLNSKFNKLDTLQTAFKKHQEDSFYRVFEEVMDKMTSELGKAQNKYENVDKQLETDEKVTRLNKELYFFRNQCMHQFRQNQQMKEKINKVNMENMLLQKEKDGLKLLLKKKIEEKISRNANTPDYSLFPKTTTHKLFTPSTRYKPTTANKDWTSVGRSTSLKTSRRNPQASTIQDMLETLDQEVEKREQKDKDPNLLKKLNEYQILINKIRRKIQPAGDEKRITTHSTDRESGVMTDRPLKYSSKGKRIRRATPTPTPIPVDDELSGYS